MELNGKQMKKLKFATTPLILIVLFNACAPEYKCRESKPEKVPFTWGKNLKAVG